MIDDATLTLWGQQMEFGYANLLTAIAEIRRLREEVATQQARYELITLADNKASADLAAHRAVVRELAEAAHRAIRETGHRSGCLFT